jgi:phosphatidylglycerophosphate synthase
VRIGQVNDAHGFTGDLLSFYNSMLYPVAADGRVYIMATAAYILGDPPQRLWGLTSRERLARQLRAAGVPLVAQLDGVAADDRVLLINARYVFDQRALLGLLPHPGCLLRGRDQADIAAALVPGSRAAEAAALITATGAAVPPDLRVLDLRQIERYDRQLRKAEPPLLERLDAENRARLEALLYGNAYKGITDLVTKWLWPRPARFIVRLCAYAGITPNMVTSCGLALVVIAGWLFLHGHYASGLVCGWVMTLLDTVDGKLARVTIRSSAFGHWLDHGMDIVHPPIWYVLWGIGLPAAAPLGGFTPTALYGWIVGGYVAGRAIEGLFHTLGACGMFAWRPFDAYFRLVTARRNPCLIILTAAVLLGRPGWGLLGVALWTVASSGIMFARLVYAACVRITTGPLESWLRDPERAAASNARAYRTFSGTRSAYG